MRFYLGVGLLVGLVLAGLGALLALVNEAGGVGILLGSFPLFLVGIIGIPTVGAFANRAAGRGNP